MTRLFSKKSLLRTDSNDPRGATFIAALRGGDYAFVEIRKGALRGGHLHDKETVQIVVKGRIRFEFVDPATRKHDDAIAGPMDVLEIPAGIAHLAEGLEDCIFIEPVNVGKILNTNPSGKESQNYSSLSRQSSNQRLSLIFPRYNLVQFAISSFIKSHIILRAPQNLRIAPDGYSGLHATYSR